MIGVERTFVIDVGEAIGEYEGAIKALAGGFGVGDFMALFGTPEDYVIETVALITGLENSCPHLAALCKYPQYIPVRVHASFYFEQVLSNFFNSDPHIRKINITSVAVIGHLATIRCIAME